MKRVIFIFLSIVCLIVPVSAQKEECEPEVDQAWKDSTFSILLRYNEYMASPNGLETALKIQELRREFDALEVPDCAVVPDAKLFANMLNLTTDSLVATAAGNTPLADSLSSVVTPLHEAVVAAFVGFEPSTTPTPTEPPGLAIQILSPQEGAIIPQVIPISGTYEADLIGDKETWLFVVAPTGLMFPQALAACEGDRRVSIPLSRFDNTWQMEIGVGSPPDNGKDFTLIVGLADETASAALHEYFEASCPENFSGMTQEEVFGDLGVEPIHFVKVTRQP